MTHPQKFITSRTASDGYGTSLRVLPGLLLMEFYPSSLMKTGRTTTVGDFPSSVVISPKFTRSQVEPTNRRQTINMAKHLTKKNLASKSHNPHVPMPWDYALQFMMAGRCIVTLESISDGSRNTYLIEQVIDEVKSTDDDGNEITTDVRRDKWFVSLLTGGDNTKNYRYLGFIDKRFGPRAFRTTKGTQKNKAASAVSINRVGDVVRDLVAGANNGHQTRIWHHGVCGRCTKIMTVPASVATGVGPTCAKALGINLKDVSPDLIEKLAALAPSIKTTN